MVRRSLAAGLLVLLGAGCMKPGAGRSPSAPMEIVVAPVPGSAPVETVAAKGASSARVSWTARDEVDVEWRGRWWPALVLERRGASFLVHYVGYGQDWDELVPESRIRDRRVELSPLGDAPAEVDVDP